MANINFLDSFATPSPYDQQMLEAKRRQQIADLLQQQASQSIVPQQGRIASPISPVAGLAQALAGGLSGLARRQAENAQLAAKSADEQAAMQFLRGGPSSRQVYGEGAASGLTPEQASVLNIDSRIAKPSALTPGQAAAINLDQRVSPVPASDYRDAQMFTVGPTPQERSNYLMQGFATGTPTTRALAQALMAQKPTEYEKLEFTKEGKPYMMSKFGDVKWINDPNLTPRDQYTMQTAEGQANRAQAQQHWQGLSADQQANLVLRARNGEIEARKFLDEAGVYVPVGAGLPAASAPRAAAPVQPTANQGMQRGAGQQAAQPMSASTGGVVNTLPAAAQRKYAQEMPKAEMAAQSGLQKIDSIQNFAKDLLQHPGLSGVTGRINQYSALDMTDQTRSARSLVDALKSQISVQAIQDARNASTTGGAYGNMTEKEWPRLESAYAALDQAKSTEDYKKALKNLLAVTDSIKSNMKNNWESIYGRGTLNYKAPDYIPESASYIESNMTDTMRKANAILQGSL